MNQTQKIPINPILAPDTLLKGGEYRIIRTLGQGGFGITYLAEHVSLGATVCIKEFYVKQLCQRTERDSVEPLSEGMREDMLLFKAKFLNEARKLSQMRHPNIVNVRDLFEENSTVYYVMEYIEGRSLNDIIKRNGRLSEEDARRYISGVASALSYLHDRTMLHLDIKPDNIMVRNEDDSVVVIDFGLAKHYDPKTGKQTTIYLGAGTPGYSPFEQSLNGGGVVEFTAATDIYSLGATLFALVTGTVPPEATTIPDVGFPALPAELSNAMSKAITTAMTYSIKGRPQSIAEFMQLLNGNNAGGVVPPKKPTTPVASKPTQKPTAPKKRSKWWLWLLLLAIVGGGVFAYLSSQPKDNHEPTPTPDPVLCLTSDSCVTVEHGGGNGTIRYTLENPVSGVNLSVSDNANWLTTSRSGNTISYSASANESQSSRTATITVSYGDQSFDVVVTQNGKPAPDPVLRLTSNSRVTVEHGGGNGTIRYTLENPVSGVNLSVSDDASWLTTSRSGNTISYSASANESQSSRTATITVSYGSQSFEVAITQSGKPAPSPTQSRSNYTESGGGYGISMKMVWVEGGTFQMGSANGDSDEQPVHPVTLSGYWIAETEVTQAQWEAVMGTTVRQQRDLADPSWSLRGEGNNYPMYYVSYTEAMEFCRRLSSATGKRYTLPTEAQWEYAARGGQRANGTIFTYSGSNIIGDVAWYSGNSSNQTHPVKSKQNGANQLGLYDMSGNVWEWCLDWYSSSYYSSSPQNNPQGPSSGSSRVRRGGSWINDASYCRVAGRIYGTPSIRDNNYGFRVVCLP